VRAREFYLIETQIRGASATSVPKYMAEIVRVLRAAEKDPDVMLELQLSSNTPGQGDLIPFQPDPNQGDKLENDWAAIYAAPATPNKYPEWYVIMDHEIEGTIPSDMAQYNWPAQMAKPEGQKFKVPIGSLSKTPDLKGASKSYNLGNVTEGIFAGAVYLRLNQAGRISTPQLIDWLVNVPQNRATYPTEYPDARTNYANVDQEDQDFLFVKIHLSENNFQALKEKPTLDGLVGHINGVTNYVNQVEVPRIRQTFINDVVERIEIKAEGPVDEKASTVDINIHVTNAETEETNLIVFERSVKGGSTKVKQFDQKTAGGARKYGVVGVSAQNLRDVDFDENRPMHYKKNQAGLEMIIEKRWQYVEDFWHSWSPDINMTGQETKKKFKKAWMDSMKKGAGDVNYLDAYWHSYRRAAQQLSKLLDTTKGDEDAVNDWISKFYGDLHTHAGKTGRPGAPPPMARMTSFDRGAYEELDFGELEKYVGKADMTAILSDTKIHGGERARPEVHIIAKNGGEVVINKETGHIVPEKQIPKMQKGTTYTVSWKAGEVFLIFRFFAAMSKLSNLIEKGDLLRKWAWVASSDTSGNPTDAMGVVKEVPTTTQVKA
jgi:hypothetical protein